MGVHASAPPPARYLVEYEFPAGGRLRRAAAAEHPANEPRSATLMSAEQTTVRWSTVSNSQFLDELAKALPADSLLWTVAFIGNPDGHPGWYGREYHGSHDARAVVDGYSRQNAYFSTAALRYIEEPVEENGVTTIRQVIRRRKANFSRLLALVVDDANPDDLEASVSWVLGTSPGKRQVGFFLDESDPDCANLKLVDALVTRMATMGLIGGDRSGNNAVRYVRLPQGENQKPRPTGAFTVKLLHWDPEVRYSLADAAAALSIDLEEIRKIADSPQPVSTGSIHGEQDEKLEQATHNVLAGNDLHDSCNIIAASLIASGTHPGAVVNHLRALMKNSQAPRSERWTARYNDIPRSVETAFQKFSRPAAEVVVAPSTSEIINEPILRDVDDLLANLRSVEFIVDGYFESDALSMIFGPPGSGKSFVALDVACCVATGTPWHGMKVKQGAVIAIVGEGLNGIGRRIKAWSIQNKVSEKLLGGAMHEFGESTDYDVLLDDGTRLAPKAVFGLAASTALGFAVKPRHFAAGIDSPCFRIIESAGYEIVSKGTLGNVPAEDRPADDFEWTEGTPKLRRHLSRERSPSLRKAKIAEFRRKNNGRVVCERCGEDPVLKYNTESAEACIEVHHAKVQVSEMQVGHRTRLEDLQCLCANCHRIVHREMRKAELAMKAFAGAGSDQATTRPPKPE